MCFSCEVLIVNALIAIDASWLCAQLLMGTYLVVVIIDVVIMLFEMPFSIRMMTKFFSAVISKIFLLMIAYFS